MHFPTVQAVPTGTAIVLDPGSPPLQVAPSPDTRALRTRVLQVQLVHGGEHALQRAAGKQALELGHDTVDEDVGLRSQGCLRRCT